MDPDTTLTTLRILTDLVREGAVVGESATARVLGEIASAFSDLDDWLSRGGFLPGDWER